MPARGRPALTQEELHERIQAYCKRHDLPPPQRMIELPPYPAGERETPQHRDWIVLYKAISRFRRRQAILPDAPERVAALAAQRDQCPICLLGLGARGVAASQPAADATLTLVHPGCDALLSEVLKLGPSVLDRLRAYAWPESRPSGKPSKSR